MKFLYSALLAVVFLLNCSWRVTPNGVQEQVIYTLDSLDALQRLLALCEKNPSAFQAKKKQYKLPKSCSAIEHSKCSRHWHIMSFGVAGIFTADDRKMISACVGKDSILLEEDDLIVEKDVFKELKPRNRFRRRKLLNTSVSNKTTEAIVSSYDENESLDDSSFSSEMNLPYDKAIVLKYSDETGTIKGEQPVHKALWNLDRIDQIDLPLNGKYSYDNGGANVHAYVLDSGIRRTHVEFASGGKTRVSHAYDFVDDHISAEDCDGHGTHIAGTLGGHSVGTAKLASIHSVRVLDCNGQGMISNVVSGLEWVASNHKAPAVVTLSLGIPVGGWSQTLEQTVEKLIKDYNILVVIASGNSQMDSCSIAPANVASSLTVAASDLIQKFDNRMTRRGTYDILYKYSNTGSCIDIYAPGTDIYSACGGVNRCKVPGDTQYAWSSGTSMAVPHVAGVAALYLSRFPNSTASEVKEAILSNAIGDRIGPSLKAGSPLPETPNRMLYSKIPGLEMNETMSVQGFSMSSVGDEYIDPFLSLEEHRRFLHIFHSERVAIYRNGTLTKGWQDWSWNVDVQLRKVPLLGLRYMNETYDSEVLQVNIFPDGALSFHRVKGFSAATVEIWLRGLEEQDIEAIRISIESDSLDDYVDKPEIISKKAGWQVLFFEVPTDLRSTAGAFNRITIKGKNNEIPISFELYKIVIFR